MKKLSYLFFLFYFLCTFQQGYSQKNKGLANFLSIETATNETPQAEQSLLFGGFYNCEYNTGKYDEGNLTGAWGHFFNTSAMYRKKLAGKPYGYSTDIIYAYGEPTRDPSPYNTPYFPLHSQLARRYATKSRHALIFNFNYFYSFRDRLSKKLSEKLGFSRTSPWDISLATGASLLFRWESIRWKNLKYYAAEDEKKLADYRAENTSIQREHPIITPPVLSSVPPQINPLNGFMTMFALNAQLNFAYYVTPRVFLFLNTTLYLPVAGYNPNNKEMGYTLFGLYSFGTSEDAQEAVIAENYFNYQHQFGVGIRLFK